MQIGKRTVAIWIFAGISLLWLVFLWKVPGICFETNDDKMITEILSGAVTGEPEGHVVYVNYLLSAPLAGLYRLLPQIPWYGGMLLLFHATACTAVLSSAYSLWQGKKWEEAAVLAGVCGCYFLLSLYMICVLQYTSTAGMLAVAGYVCLILHRDQKKGRLLFFFFQLAAFLLRGQAMLMIQPLGGAVYLGWCLADKSCALKEKGKKIGIMLLLSGAVLLLGEAGTLAGYHGEGWQEFNRFNKARTELFDYYHAPDYEEVEAILDRYHVTRAQYEGFCRFVILQEDVAYGGCTAECLEELVEYVKAAYPRQVTLEYLLREQWAYFRQSPAVEAAWCVAFLWVLLFGRFSLCLPLGGLACGRVLVWGYLLYRGRAPERVTLPLLFCEAVLIAVVLARDYGKTSENRKQIFRGRRYGRACVILAALGAAFLLQCFFVAADQYKRAAESNDSQQIYIEGLIQIEEYCKAHPEERYLLDTWSMRFYNGEALETRLNGRQNFAYTGSWFSGSPPMKAYLEEYLAEREGQLSLIVEDDGKGLEHAAVAYLAEWMGVEPVLEERLAASHGGGYLVWKIRRFD